MVSVRADVESRLSEIDGVVVSTSMFGHGDAFWVNGKEIAHFERDDVIEVRLTRAAIRDRRPVLKADDRVELRPSGADWITVRLGLRPDIAFVVELVTIAAQAHQPPTGEAPKLPPTGEALRRRRRLD